MEWHFECKGCVLNDQVRMDFEKKLGRLKRYFPPQVTKGEVVLIYHKHIKRKAIAYGVSISVNVAGTFIRSVEQNSTFAKAFDEALAKFKRQLIRFKERRDTKQNVSLDGGVAFEMLGDMKQLKKRKAFKLKPLFVADAIEQMELLDHDFYLFLNRDTKKTAVVYRRDDGQYGLIESEA